jgi:Fe-coproporphyrin III synthase
VSGPAGRLPALQIHPTRRCNLRCLHCYSDSGPEVSEELDEHLVHRVLADAAQLGYRVLAVSGGEPLLHEPLPRILRAAHERGLITTVTSNGMLLDERRLALLEPDTDLLAISLDGVPESHAEMRASSRAFDDMAGRLPGLRASGIPFGFIFTLTFHNVHELDWVARFAIEQGAKLLQIHPLEPVGRAGQALGESVPDMEESAAALIEAARLREQYADRIEIQLDVATLGAVEDHPEKIFASEDELDGEESIADLIAPIVLETSGLVAPLQYGFPRAWCFGNVRQASLHELAVAWAQTRLLPFRALCREVRADILRHPEVPVLNWYVHVHRAASGAQPELERQATA